MRPLELEKKELRAHRVTFDAPMAIVSGHVKPIGMRGYAPPHLGFSEVVLRNEAGHTYLLRYFPSQRVRGGYDFDMRGATHLRVIGEIMLDPMIGSGKQARDELRLCKQTKVEFLRKRSEPKKQKPRRF